MVQVTAAEEPLLGVTVNCEVLDEIVVFSSIPVKVMLNVYCCDAPGSPVIAVPLFVFTEFAV